jgi:hypothetical protein
MSGMKLLEGLWVFGLYSLFGTGDLSRFSFRCEAERSLCEVNKTAGQVCEPAGKLAGL